VSENGANQAAMAKIVINENGHRRNDCNNINNGENEMAINKMSASKDI
jgi:hypothetical protein